MTKKSSKRSETKIRTMRQGQQKIKLDIKKPLPSSPPLPLPYPPTQKVEQIVAKLVAKPKLCRFPNAFIMYRNEYVQYLKSQGYHISMTELSPMISTSWKKEPEFVKETYTKLSSEAEKMYVRDTGNTPQQIIYRNLQTPKSLNGKIDSEMIPKLDQTHHAHHHHHHLNESCTFGDETPNYNGNYYNFNNLYDGRILDLPTPTLPTFSYGAQYSLSNTIPTIPPNNNNLPSIIPSPISSTIPSISTPRINDDTIVQDDLNFILSQTFPPPTLEGFNLMGLSPPSFDRVLETMSASSTSSIPSDTSLDDISLLFPPELDESRFYEKPDFSTPIYSTGSMDGQSPLQPSVYFGQSFANTSDF